MLDVMPSDPAVLGLASRWHAAALPHAAQRSLPSGAEIRAITPPYLLAAKLEALESRGRGDLIASRDFADAVALLDGRAELVEEVRSSPEDVRAFVAMRLAKLRANRRLPDAIAGALLPDAASQARAQLVVRPRLEALALHPIDPSMLCDELLDPRL